MASVSSLGIGSNLDLNGLLDKLTTSESAPLVALQKRKDSFTAKLSAYGVMQNVLSNFQAAAAKLAVTNLFQGTTVTSSASDVLTATVSAAGQPGAYTVNVTPLATSQSLASAGVVDSKAVVGKGTVTVSFGKISGGTLDPATGKYTGASFSPDATVPGGSIVIDDTNNSLEGLRDSINANAALGLTASIVKDGSAAPYHLLLSSRATGEASSIRIGVAGDASLQNLIGQDSSATQAMQQTAIAGNAVLNVNGLSISSSSNTVSDSVQGVTLTLAKAGTTTLKISTDSAAVQGAVGAFVAAYNTLQGAISQLTKFDVAKKTGAPLVGDSALLSIQTRIRSVLNTPQTGALQVLSKVGVSFQRDGTLTLDSTKLNAAFSANQSAVSELFAGKGGNTGFGSQVAALVAGFTDVTGILGIAKTGVNSTLKSLDLQFAAGQTRVNATVARYRAQFSQLDLMISRMSSTATYLTQQFGTAASK